MYKSKRFVREYANYKIADIQKLAESFKDEYQNSFTEKRIMKAVEAYENGLISADSAMLEIARA